MVVYIREMWIVLLRVLAEKRSFGGGSRVHDGGSTKVFRVGAGKRKLRRVEE